MSDIVRITEEPLDVAALTAAVTAPNTGATAVFVGTTRDNFQVENHNLKKFLSHDIENI